MLKLMFFSHVNSTVVSLYMIDNVKKTFRLSIVLYKYHRCTVRLCMFQTFSQERPFIRKSQASDLFAVIQNLCNFIHCIF